MVLGLKPLEALGLYPTLKTLPTPVLQMKWNEMKEFPKGNYSKGEWKSDYENPSLWGIGRLL